MLQNFMQKKNNLKINYICSSPEKLNIKKGILTPMECAGHLIVDRLKSNGIEIEVREKS